MHFTRTDPFTLAHCLRRGAHLLCALVADRLQKWLPDRAGISDFVQSCLLFGLQVHIRVVPLIRPQHLIRGLLCLFLAALSVNLLPLPFLACIFDSSLRYVLVCVALGARNTVRCRISYPFMHLSLCIVLWRTTVG